MSELSFYITKEGIEKAKNESKELLERRAKNLEELVAARALGDLRENGGYIAAKQAQIEIDRRVRVLDQVISKAKIIDTETITSFEIVKFGLKVHIEHEEGRTEHFHIVGEYESDIKNKRISITSPIGRALIGRKMNEWVDIEMPNGSEKSLKIIKIYK